MVVFENTNLFAFAKISPSPTANPVIVHAEIMLLRQMPLPADAPMTCRASMFVLEIPMASAAMT
jgi:hypothetical protein